MKTKNYIDEAGHEWPCEVTPQAVSHKNGPVIQCCKCEFASNDSGSLKRHEIEFHPARHTPTIDLYNGVCAPKDAQFLVDHLGCSLNRAAFIVKACNAYAPMLKELQGIRMSLEYVLSVDGRFDIDSLKKMHKNVDSVLAASEGK